MEDEEWKGGGTQEVGVEDEVEDAVASTANLPTVAKEEAMEGAGESDTRVVAGAAGAGLDALRGEGAAVQYSRVASNLAGEEKEEGSSQENLIPLGGPDFAPSALPLSHPAGPPPVPQPLPATPTNSRQRRCRIGPSWRARVLEDTPR